MSDRNYPLLPGATYVNSDNVFPLAQSSQVPFAHYTPHNSLPHTPNDIGRYKSPPPPEPNAAAGGMISGTRLQPHLTLGPRLLLATLSPALIPLILTISHLIVNRSSTSDMATSLRSSMLSACSGLAKGAASLHTLPRYLAMQTNEEMVRGAQMTIRGIGSALMDVVTIVEVVVIFMLDTYRSLLMCTLELAVRGTLELMIGAVKGITEGITTGLNAVRSNIQSDISAANTFIQDAASKMNSATKLIGVTITIPQFSIPSLSGLQDVKVSTEFQDSLIRLNASIPSLSVLREKLEDLIEKPFALLKAEMNATRLELAASFNTSMLPVPSLASLSASRGREMEAELCGNLDTSLVDDTANALYKLANISIGLMFLALFLVWAALCIWEWRRWRTMKDIVDSIAREWEREGKADAWRAVAIVENPVLEKYGSPVLRRLTRSERARVNLRWYLAYLSHPTCLALLFVASVGFLSLQLQLLALKGIKDHARSNANTTVAASTNSLSTKLNAMAIGASQQYAADYNLVISGYQRRIDDELFGKWVNTTGVALNATLVGFYDDVEKVIMQAFGGTVLYGPISTFMYCMLGCKIDSLSAALTWLRDHGHVTLPTLPVDVLLLSPAAMAEIIDPISAAAVGSGTDGNDEGIVGDLIGHFQKAIEYERNFYAILLGVWLAFALVGLLVVAWNSGGEARYRTWRGGEVTNAPQDGHINSEKVWACSKEKTPLYNEHAKHPSRRAPSPSIYTPHFAVLGREDRGGPGARPSFIQKSTLGSLASLIAPGERFLNLEGRKTPALVLDDSDRLVAPRTSSEWYTKARTLTSERERLQWAPETPPPFWVKRFGGERSLSSFPSRGHKHGQAMSQAAGGSGMGGMERLESEEKVPSLGQRKSDPRENESQHERFVYPRPMSRASTVHTAESTIFPKNPFETPPPLPGKRESLQMLDHIYDSEPDHDQRDPFIEEAQSGGGGQAEIMGPETPMSKLSFAQSQGRVEALHVARAAKAGLSGSGGMNERRRREPMDGLGRI